MNKKIKILISGALVSVLIISSPFTFKTTKAIVGVDDAILFTVLGLGAVTSIGASYGVSKSGIMEKAGNALGDSLQNIGSGWKTIEDGKAFAKSTTSMLPEILQAFKDLEGSTYEEQQEPTTEGYKIPINYIKNGTTLLTTIRVEVGGSLAIPLYNSDGSFTQQSLSINKSTANINILIRNRGTTYADIYCSATTDYNDSTLFSSPSIVEGFSGYLLIPTNSVLSSYTSSTIPNVTDVQNKPTSISLDKAQTESIALDYAKKYPNDNNGDKKVDYGTLIPFFFDMLEKKLGDGTITPTNLSNEGIASYVYEDGQNEGMYPYDFSKNGESNIIQNVTVNNGTDGDNVSQEEKNGILNLLDNGLRATTQRMKSLNEAFNGFGKTMSGLFDFFPQDVQNILFLSIFLMAIFFILGLRR